MANCQSTRKVCLLSLDPEQRSPVSHSMGPRSALWRWLEIVGTLAAAVLLAWVVWVHTSAHRLHEAFASVLWIYYAAGVAAFFAYQAIRTFRTRLLVNRALAFFKLFVTICTQCLITTFLPSGMGDVSLVYLLRRRHRVDVYLGAATAVTARLADLFVSVVTLFISIVTFIVLSGPTAPLVPKVIYLALVGTTFVLVSTVLGVVFLARATRWGSAVHVPNRRENLELDIATRPLVPCCISADAQSKTIRSVVSSICGHVVFVVPLVVF